MNRRNLLSCVALTLPLAALGCAAMSIGSYNTLSAQVLADTNAALTQLGITLPALTKTKPPVLTAAQVAPLLADIEKAKALLAALSAKMDAVTASTPLEQVLGYVNAVLDTVPIALVPPPFNLIVVASTVIAKEIESYVASISPTPAPQPAPWPAAKRATVAAGGMTLERARAVLHATPAP
jgi:hypothetical protein